jgi:hypothetical protein
MIKKLEDIVFQDLHGNQLGRRPDNEDIVRKVNEIIEYLNNQWLNSKEW